MNDDIHGHEVMEMMNASGKAYDRATLKADIIEKFGDTATFCTCSGENMSPDELIEFLASRGKFIDGKDGFQIDIDSKCDHD